MPAADGSIPLDEPFDVQVARLRAANVLPPDEFYRLPAAKRAEAFTVSGLARLDQVQAVADSLAAAQAEGKGFNEWKREALRQDWGLPRARLETIYRTSVQTAYQSGHWQHFQRFKALRPFLMYDAINDSRTRPNHLALDGVIRPVDDPVWGVLFPPCGWNCRCTARSLSAREATRRGGVTQQIPAEGGPDPGWKRGPVPGGPGRLREALAERAARCEPGGASALWCAPGRPAEDVASLTALAERNGEMPPPKPLALAPLAATTRETLADAFAAAVGADRVTLPLAGEVTVGPEMVPDRPRSEDRWLSYAAEAIRAPQEVWIVERAGVETLHAFARFQREDGPVEASAVWERGPMGLWWPRRASVTTKPGALARLRGFLFGFALGFWALS